MLPSPPDRHPGSTRGRGAASGTAARTSLAPMMPMSAAQLFIDQSRRYLTDEYTPKIEACLERLTLEQIWWRPNESSNSIGNLVLHLAGNVRQWIVSGVGEAPDSRDRQAEFDQRVIQSGEQLSQILRAALTDVDRVLAGLTTDDLSGSRVIQGESVTVLSAIYHVVEHFGMHTGQIAFIAKLQLDADLGLSRDSKGRPWQ